MMCFWRNAIYSGLSEGASLTDGFWGETEGRESES